MRRGLYAEGLRVFRTVLAATGLRYAPTTPGAALASIILNTRLPD